MDTEIEARPTISERPSDEHQCDKATAHEQREEQGYAERVGGMGGEESILSTSIAIHDIHKNTDLIVVCGSPSCHTGFDNKVVNSACKEYTQTGTTENEEYAAEVVVVLHHDIKQ